MTKAEMRERMLLQMRNFAAVQSDAEAASAGIRGEILASAEWVRARTVCAFLPLRSEPDLLELWSGDIAPALFLPRVRGEILSLLRVDPAQPSWRSARWTLEGEPFDGAPAVPISEVDLFLVPGVAFTAAGVRLGRGGGWYDRLLSQRRAGSAVFGVCFPLQLVAELPREAHDQLVDRVITGASQ